MSETYVGIWIKFENGPSQSCWDAWLERQIRIRPSDWSLRTRAEELKHRFGARIQM